MQNVPLNGIRNAASQEIYALGSVTVSGSVTAKDTITITINGGAYTYTVKDKDTLELIVQGLVTAINKAPDPERDRDDESFGAGGGTDGQDAGRGRRQHHAGRVDFHQRHRGGDQQRGDAEYLSAESFADCAWNRIGSEWHEALRLAPRRRISRSRICPTA